MCVSPIMVRHLHGDAHKVQLVPCGHCVECLQAYQRDWSFRLTQECKRAKVAWFVTLTYNDENLPLGDDEHGNTHSVVLKSDIQLFFKRLRKNLGEMAKGLSYFLTAEYGCRTNRAHYHFIMVCPAIDEYEVAYKAINWSWCKGFIMVKRVSEQAISYVTKYVNKVDRRFHLVPPFRLMSRGLGLNYLSGEMIAHYMANPSFDAFFKGHRISLPRYYREKLSQIWSNANAAASKYGVQFSDLIENRVVKKAHARIYQQIEEILNKCEGVSSLVPDIQKDFPYIFPKVEKVTYIDQKCAYMQFVNDNDFLLNVIAESDRKLYDVCLSNRLSHSCYDFSTLEESLMSHKNVFT